MRARSRGRFAPTPIEDRFWSKVDRSGGPDACWPWLAYRDDKGYGRFRDGKKKVPAQRVSWKLTNGPIPLGLHVLHTCDFPACVNPKHLWLGTHAQNMADMVAKGRWTPRRHLRGEAHRKAKLTEAIVRDIRKRYGEGESPTVIARDVGTDFSNVVRIARREAWRHVN